MPRFASPALLALLAPLAPLAPLPLPAAAAELGSVAFANSGAAAAQPAFQRGLAALHSFWYPEAEEAFREAREIDPGFALAYWGEALTHDHSLWEEQDRAAGRRALEALAPTPEERLAKAPTERERDYLRSVELLFATGEVDDRRRAYSAALERLAARYPDDPDAAALYALTLQTIDRGGQEGVRKRMRSAAILERLRDRFPEHPGVLHYLIHAYDDPVHAPLGLRPALVYADVAPAANHALHMPSHIFVQLGMWERVAASNLDAWEASVAWTERRGLSVEERDFHSLSWRHYALLQLGREREAAEALALVARLARETGSERLANVREGMAARQAVESGRFAPAGDAETAGGELAFALGLRRVSAGEIDAARPFLARLREVAAREGERPHRWSSHAAILADQLEGLILIREGRSDEGLARLAAAAQGERSLDPPSGPPRPLHPALETYGEALAAAGRPADALREFEAALDRTPDRPRALLGAARAAAALGHAETARAHRATLARIWSGADPGHPGATEVREVLELEAAPATR